MSRNGQLLQEMSQLSLCGIARYRTAMRTPARARTPAPARPRTGMHAAVFTDFPQSSTPICWAGVEYKYFIILSYSNIPSGGGKVNTHKGLLTNYRQIWYNRSSECFTWNNLDGPPPAPGGVAGLSASGAITRPLAFP